MLPDLRQETRVVSKRAVQNTEETGLKTPPDLSALPDDVIALEAASIWLGEARLLWIYHCWNLSVNLLFGLLGLLLLLFVFPFIAFCIYFESPGPIFYTQERLGHRRKPFRIYKFRSMRVDAEPNGQAIWASSNDERVTRIGRILRSTHLDELPQVFNILRGDMALIGPRPERAVFADRLEQRCPTYHYRLLVKPGLTGWAQVKYGYGGNSSELRKLYYDLDYIQRRSIRFDILILLKTVAEVLTFRGR